MLSYQNVSKFAINSLVHGLVHGLTTTTGKARIMQELTFACKNHANVNLNQFLKFFERKSREGTKVSRRNENLAKENEGSKWIQRSGCYYSGSVLRLVNNFVKK